MHKRNEAAYRHVGSLTITMDQLKKLNIGQDQISGTPLKPRKRDGLDRVTNGLIILILIIVFLVLYNVIFATVESPRTSLERDIMDNTAKLRDNPKDAVAHAGLGIAYIKMKSFAAAVREFKVAVKLNPGSSQYRYNLGVVYYELGRLNEAKVELQKGIKNTPKWEVLHFQLGNILMKQKKYDEAINSFKWGSMLVPGNADAHFQIGKAYDLKGEDDEAIAHYREALKYVPDYVLATQAIEKLQKKRGR